MTTATHMTTAYDVVAMLRRHYLPEGRPPGGLFAAEIASPDGRRRADALWLPTTIAGGNGLVGHEVKVARADVLAELADPTKAEPWSQYCARWWLVVADPRLVDGLDVPEAWGIMAPPSGRRTRSMTVLRPAPTLKPLDPAPAFRRLLVWLMHKTDGRVGTLERELAYAIADRDGARRQLEEFHVTGSRPSPHVSRVAAIVRAVEERRRADGAWHSIDDDLVIDTLVDTHAARDAQIAVTRKLERAIRAVELLADPFRDVGPQLEQARRLIREVADA